MPQSAAEFLATPPPPATFADRVKDFVGIPRSVTFTDWAETRAAQTAEAAKNQLLTAQNEALGGFGPEIAGVLAAPFGYKPTKVAESQRKQLQDYRAKHQVASTLAGTAGSVVGLVGGGEVVGATGRVASSVPRVARVIEATRPVAAALARGAARLAPAAAVAGGAAGAMNGEQFTGSTTPAGRAEGAAEGAAEAFRASGHIPEAMVASALGALQGAGEAGPGRREEGAGTGALVGGATGLLVPTVLSAGGQVARAVDAQTGYMGDKAVRKLFGLSESDRVTAPVRAAARRLKAAMAHEKQPTRAEIDALQARREALGLPPAHAFETAGEGAQGLARAASRVPGPVRKQARALAESTRENLPYELRNQADRLAPHTDNTAEQEIERLNESRAGAAALQYREPYARPVELNPDIMDRLETPQMKAARLQTRATQVERGIDSEESRQIVRELDNLDRYYKELGEFEQAHKDWVETEGWKIPETVDKAQRDFLAQVKNPAQRESLLRQLGAERIPEPTIPEPPTVSAGTLDRIRTEAQHRADSLKSTPVEPKATHGLGTALESHAQAIDEHLDAVPHLAEARENYKAHSIRIDALKDGEKHIMGSTPREFDQWLDGLVNKSSDPEAMRKSVYTDLRVSLRDALTGRGKDPNGAARVWQALDNNVNFKDNVIKVLGKKEAADLFEVADIVREEARMATFMSGAGSMTALNQQDTKIANGLASVMSTHHAVQFLKDWVNEGRRVTPEEASAIWEFMEGDPHALMDAVEREPNGFLGAMVRVGVAKSVAGQAAAPPAPVQTPPGSVTPASPSDDPFAAPTGDTAPPPVSNDPFAAPAGAQ